jgi:hypothetical protein
MLCDGRSTLLAPQCVLIRFCTTYGFTSLFTPTGFKDKQRLRGIMSSSAILRELSSNNGGTTSAGSLRATSSSAKSRVAASRQSTTTNASSAGMSTMFQKLSEQDASRALHNLDRQYRMKDGAPRVLFWSSALKLPCNHDAFRTLSLRRVDVQVAGDAMREVKGLLAFARDERCNSRLWSCLVIHDSKIAPIPFIPYLCVAVCRGIPSNPICAFETSMHLLSNMCREWVEAYPRAPTRLLSRLDRYLQSHPSLSGLWNFFNDDHLDGGCSLLDYLWVPMQTFLLLNIKPAEAWVQFMDDVICSPDGANFFYAAVIALLWQLKDAFFVCESRDQVLAVLGTEIQEPKAVHQLLQRARSIATKLVVPLDAPIEYLPVRGEYYPLLHIGGRPPIPEKVDKAAKLRQIEEDQAVLERRIAVEVSTLSLNAEMKRFHTSLGNLRLSSDDYESMVPSVSGKTSSSNTFVDPSIPPAYEPYYQPYMSGSNAKPPHTGRAATFAATAVSPLNPIRLCSLVMEGPSEPIELDLAARRRNEDGEVYYATTEDDATTHTAPPSEPPLPIMNSLSPQERDISMVPDAVVRAAALMLASQSVSRQRSESLHQQPINHAASPQRQLELSASVSPTQRGVSTAPSGNPQQSFNASVGYTQPSASHAGRSSHTGSSVRPAVYTK